MIASENNRTLYIMRAIKTTRCIQCHTRRVQLATKRTSIVFCNQKINFSAQLPSNSAIMTKPHYMPPISFASLFAASNFNSSDARSRPFSCFVRSLMIWLMNSVSIAVIKICFAFHGLPIRVDASGWRVSKVGEFIELAELKKAEKPVAEWNEAVKDFILYYHSFFNNIILRFFHVIQFFQSIKLILTS